MTPMPRNHTKNRMSKSVLVGALLGLLTFVTGLSHHPAAPANAASGDGITAYVSPPFVQGPPSSYGTPIETFDSWSTCASFPASAVGTFTGTCTSSSPSYIWGGATTATDTPTVSGTPTRFVIAPVGQDLTLTFATPAKYFGFWWSAGSAGNTVKLYTSASSSTPAATFTTDTINSILGASIPSPYPGAATVSSLDGSTYKKGYYFGRPAHHTTTTPTSYTASNNQSHAYLNIFASGSIAFTKVQFTGTGFEFDNVAISTATQTPTQNLVFIESVLGKTVTFMPNGGNNTMSAQTEPSAANLTANSFTRPGYTFSGWHTNSSGTGGTSYADQAPFNFLTDITLHAQWTLDPLTISYNTQGGSAIANGSTTAVAPISASPGTPTRDGYTFNGWFTATTGGTAISFPYTHGRTASFTLYAQWTPDPLTIAYNTQGGSTIGSGNTTSGASIAASPGTPTRDGYTFNGWFTATTGGTAISFPYTHGRTANFTLYAQWTLVPVVTSPPATTTTTTTAPAPTTTTTTPAAPTVEAPRVANAGEQIYIMAKGFRPGEKVVLRIGNGKTTTLIANEKGEVRLQVVLNSADKGTNQVVAFTAASGRTVSREIQVTTPEELPATGSTSLPLLEWGSFIALLGCGLLLRRRLTHK